MITDNEAIEKAIAYFESLPQEYLGQPSNVRLESILRLADKYVVMISYLAKSKIGQQNEPATGLNPKLDLSNFLSEVRYFKELEISAKTGEVISMKDPEPRYSKAV